MTSCSRVVCFLPHDIDPQATHLASDTDTVLAMVRDIAAVHKDDGLVYDAGNATNIGGFDASK